MKRRFIWSKIHVFDYRTVYMWQHVDDDVSSISYKGKDKVNRKRRNVK